MLMDFYLGVVFSFKVPDILLIFLFMGEIISIKLLLDVCLLSRSSANETFLGVVEVSCILTVFLKVSWFFNPPGIIMLSFSVSL